MNELVSLSVEDGLLTVTCRACGSQSCVELAEGRSTPQVQHSAGCPMLSLDRALTAGEQAKAASSLAEALALAGAIQADCEPAAARVSSNLGGRPGSLHPAAPMRAEDEPEPVGGFTDETPRVCEEPGCGAQLAGRSRCDRHRG